MNCGGVLRFPRMVPSVISPKTTLPIFRPIPRLIKIIVCQCCRTRDNDCFTWQTIGGSKPATRIHEKWYESNACGAIGRKRVERSRYNASHPVFFWPVIERRLSLVHLPIRITPPSPVARIWVKSPPVLTHETSKNGISYACVVMVAFIPVFSAPRAKRISLSGKSQPLLLIKGGCGSAQQTQTCPLVVACYDLRYRLSNNSGSCLVNHVLLFSKLCVEI